MNSAIGLLGSMDFHGPILLSWMLVIFYGGNNLQLSLPQPVLLKQIGVKSTKLEAFKYLLSCLQSPIFAGNSVIQATSFVMFYNVRFLLLTPVMCVSTSLYRLSSCILILGHCQYSPWNRLCNAVFDSLHIRGRFLRGWTGLCSWFISCLRKIITWQGSKEISHFPGKLIVKLWHV